MSNKNIITDLISEKFSDAKQQIYNSLMEKANELLEIKKIEIGSNIFNFKIDESIDDLNESNKKHDIYVNGKYVASTTQSKTAKEAKEKFLKAYPEHSTSKVQVQSIKEDYESVENLEEGTVHPADAHRILNQTGGIDTNHFALHSDDIEKRIKLAKEHGYVAKGDSATGRSKAYRTTLHLQRQAAKYKQNESVEDLNETFTHAVYVAYEHPSLGERGKILSKHSNHISAEKHLKRKYPGALGNFVGIKEITPQKKLTKEDYESVEDLDESKVHPVKHFDDAGNLTKKTDHRYSVTKEYTGHSSGKPQHVVRFADKYLDDFPDHESAANFAQKHSKDQMEKDINTVKKLTREDYDELNELSKKTLGNYIQKASFDAGMAGFKQGLALGNAGKYHKNPDKKTSDEMALRDAKRQIGIHKAVKKLTKEDYDELNENISSEAHELVLHANNDEHLYKSSYVPIAKNLEKKFKNGTYDHEKAKKLWKYHADRAADSYAKEYGSKGQKGHHIFSPAHRKEAAETFADEHHAEMKAGNFHA